MARAPIVTVGKTGRVLVLASTFPSGPDDPVPTFVRDQIVAISRLHPELEFSVLAPHDRRSRTQNHSVHDNYTEHRFHYFWPRRAERLAGRGIMPALRENPAFYLTVPFLFLGEFSAALRIARRSRPQVIYAHWFTPQAVVASWVSRWTGIPFVFTTHASDVDVWRRVPGIGARIVNSASRRARAISAVSTRSRDKLTSFFAKSRSSVEVAVIPMGVDIPDPSAGPALRAGARERLGLDGRRVHLFMGRLVEKKGVAYLLESLRTVEDELGEWLLVIAGDGPLAEELRALSHELGLAERVRFVGFLTGAAKEDYLRAADVFVVPSIETADGDAEGLPVALLEGLAHGLACVATNESGADGIISHGVDGFLCPQRDVQALAVSLLAVHSLDGPARDELSMRALSLAENFSWPQIARQHYDALFAPILGQKDIGR